MSPRPLPKRPAAAAAEEEARPPSGARAIAAPRPVSPQGEVPSSRAAFAVLKKKAA